MKFALIKAATQNDDLAQIVNNFLNNTEKPIKLFAFQAVYNPETIDDVTSLAIIFLYDELGIPQHNPQQQTYPTPQPEPETQPQPEPVPPPQPK